LKEKKKKRTIGADPPSIIWGFQKKPTSGLSSMLEAWSGAERGGKNAERNGNVQRVTVKMGNQKRNG